MAIMFTLGRGIGKAGAYAYEGTKLASTQLAQGASEGYAEKAAELRAAREAVLAQTGFVFTPPPPRVHKVKAQTV